MTDTETDPTPGYKHVVMQRWDSFTHLDDNDKPVTVTTEHKAVMDVPDDQLDAVVADANTRWAKVTVTEECPDSCPAQLAAKAGSGKSAARKSTAKTKR